MSILVNNDTRVITQGMTSNTGTFHTDAVEELPEACKSLDGLYA